MPNTVRYLLLQMRNQDDPMRTNEVECFSRALATSPDQIGVFDLLSGLLDETAMDRADMFLLGGSGDYSAAGDADWLDRALESLRRVHASGKPTFASCWGFQAMARAMGGRVVHDVDTAEVGTHQLSLTEAGKADPIFGPAGETFGGQMGHEDCVSELPANTTLLASSEKTVNQAYRFDDAPIYCTQFHPELTCEDLLLRVRAYPRYIEEIAGLPAERFVEMIVETPEASALLQRFVKHMLGEV